MKRTLIEQRIRFWESQLPKAIAEENAQKIVRELRSLNESKIDIDDSGWLKDQLSKIEDREDLLAFIEKHDLEMQQKAKTLESQKRSIFSKAWDLLKTIAKKAGSFILDHWYEILKLLALIILVWLGYSWFYSPLEKIVKQGDVSAKWMSAPGEMLQQKAIEMGEKPISDGYAHFLNQISNLDENA